MSKFNICLRNGFISSGDDFDNVAEVTHLFGKLATKLPYSVGFKIPGKIGTVAWLPSESGGNGWHNVPEHGPNVDGHGWNEIKSIFEYNDVAEITAQRIDDEISSPSIRYVFWHEDYDGVQWYKFQGVFRIDVDSTRATLKTSQPHVVYIRCDTTAPCLKVDEVKQIFTDEEFRGLRGRVIRANFLDEIEFSADCGEIVKGKVKAWPGTKLLVSDIMPDSVHVMCDTNDENLLDAALQRVSVKAREGFRKILGFKITRKDFALGYVGVVQAGDVI